MSPREAELTKELQERNGQLRRSNEQLALANAKIALLEHKIDLLVSKVFGAQSEKLDPAQLLLLLQGMDESGTERSEIDWPIGQPEGWSGSDIKSPGARGRGGSTALDGPIASA